MTPNFPKYTSLSGRALSLLVQGKAITHRDFQTHAATYRLSSYIETLRNDLGWPIDDIWLKSATSDKVGRLAKYKRYYIAEDNLKLLREQLSERLDAFIRAVQAFEARAAATAQAREW